MSSQMTELKTECPSCGQHILVDRAYSGVTVNCPTCNRPFPIPGFSPPPLQGPGVVPPPPPTATKQTESEKPAKESKSRNWMRRTWESALRDVHALVCAFSGLKPLEDFRISYFLSNPFKRRSRSEIDAYLNCGCPQTTPSLAALSSDWPRPWFFGGCCYSAFWFCSFSSLELSSSKNRKCSQVLL